MSLNFKETSTLKIITTTNNNETVKKLKKIKLESKIKNAFIAVIVELFFTWVDLVSYVVGITIKKLQVMFCIRKINIIFQDTK